MYKNLQTIATRKVTVQQERSDGNGSRSGRKSFLWLVDCSCMLYDYVLHLRHCLQLQRDVYRAGHRGHGLYPPADGNELHHHLFDDDDCLAVCR